MDTVPCKCLNYAADIGTAIASVVIGQKYTYNAFGIIKMRLKEMEAQCGIKLKCEGTQNPPCKGDLMPFIETCGKKLQEENLTAAEFSQMEDAIRDIIYCGR